MATSGVYTWAPEFSDFVDDAYERVGIDPATLTMRHARSARRSLNFLFAQWANKGVHLFTVDEQTQTLTDGTVSYLNRTFTGSLGAGTFTVGNYIYVGATWATATARGRIISVAGTGAAPVLTYYVLTGYVDFANADAVKEYTGSADGDATCTAGTPSDVSDGTIAILEGIIRRSGVDTPVHKISREQYHLIPNKTQEGLPSQVYLDRRTGTYRLWNVPENSTDVFRYYRLRRIQDVTTAQETPDVPYRWYEALTSGLAAKLAEKFAPDREVGLIAKAEARLNEANTEDRERTETSITVTL